MLTYKQIGNDRWDNTYRWTTGEFAEFLSMFPEDTPIHSDLYIHTEGGDVIQMICDIPQGETKKFISKDGQYSMIIVPGDDLTLYINEGFMSVETIKDIGLGRAKNLMRKAYDLTSPKKFVAMAFDILTEEDDD